VIDQMNNLKPRLTPEDIIRRSDEGQKNFIETAMAAFRVREAREDRKRLWAGTGLALAITAISALAIYFILHGSL